MKSRSESWFLDGNNGEVKTHDQDSNHCKRHGEDTISATDSFHQGSVTEWAGEGRRTKCYKTETGQQQQNESSVHLIVASVIQRVYTTCVTGGYQLGNQEEGQ